MNNTIELKIQHKIFDMVHDFSIQEAIFYNFEECKNPVFEDDYFHNKHLSVIQYISKLRLINEKTSDNFFYVTIIVKANIPELLDLNINIDKIRKDTWFDVDWCIHYKNMYDDNISFFYETEDGKEELSDLIDRIIEDEGDDIIAIKKLNKMING